MGLKVIGIDISDAQLESARELGADITYNSVSDAEFSRKLTALTDGGAHAAAVFSGSNAAYTTAPTVLR